MEKVLLENEQRMSRKEIAEKLVKISEGLEKSEINLKSENEELKLEPIEKPEFEIKVEEEDDGEMSLELEIEWNPEKEGEKDIEIS